MSINNISMSYQNQTKAAAPAVNEEQKKPGSDAEISKLNAEIKQEESEVKETMKEVEKATRENVGGASEKVQMLQNKMQLQQQAILMKQLKVKEMESPSKSEKKQDLADIVERSRFDQYVAGEDEASGPDNVYRLEERDGTKTVIFNRPED